MFTDLSIADLTAPAVLCLAVLLILLGRIVPRSVMVEKIEESKRWREAYETERAARVASDAQTAELLEVAKTTNSIVVAMYGTAEQIRQSGAHNVDTPNN